MNGDKLRHIVLPAAVLLVLLIGWIDYATGPGLALSLFYLVPVTAAAWFGGTRRALAVAVVASFAGLTADLAWRSNVAQSGWNGFTGMVIFIGIAWVVGKLRDDRHSLATAAAREARLARTDRVTALANSRAFLEELQREVDQGQPEQTQLALFFIDLDNFKSVNDKFGHAAGDDALQKVGDAIVATIRPEDVAARLGGDEFGVLARDVSPEKAFSIAQEILDCIRKVARDYPGTSLAATVGVAYSSVKPETAEELLHIADAAMYEGKQASKGQVIFREIQ